MYKIVNYMRWWSYEKVFTSFKEAFNIYELLDFENDPDTLIISYDDNGEQVVYDPNWIQEGEGCWIQ